jgi:hypothetical protein
LDFSYGNINLGKTYGSGISFEPEPIGFLTAVS